MIPDPIVYLIDPEGAERDSLTALLAEVNLDCNSFGSADEFLANLEPNRLGCVFAELQLGGSTALQLLRRLRQRGSSLPVILVTSYATVPLAAQAFKAGLFDVIIKPVEAFQLWDCATRAFEFHGHQLTDTHQRNDVKNRISDLTRQELQVLQMVLDGEPNKRIAARLNVSPRTIVFRRKSLMQKMNASSVAELACMIISVTSQNTRTVASRLASLLDVFTAASLCEVATVPTAPNGDLVSDHDAGPNGYLNRPK